MQDPNEDTEWNDILRQHKILPERPPSPTAAIEAAIEESVARAHANRLEGKSLKELDEIDEDGLEDEEFVEEYRQKRMAELMQQASRERFGEVVHISKPQYTEEITETSKTFPVVVHISSSNSLQSKLLASLLNQVAPRFRDVKFVDIDCRQINDKYPVSQCPTIIVYKEGNVATQVVTLATLGGNSTSLKDIDRFLVKVKVVDASDPRLLENDEDAPSGLSFSKFHDRQDSDSDY